MTSHLTVGDYRVFFDRQADGFATIGGSLVWESDELVGVLGGGPFGDDEAGQHPFLVRTTDLGHTWSEPQAFGPPVEGDRSRQSVGLSIFGPTRQGTMLTHGCHMELGARAEGLYEDLSFRAYTLLIGRRETGAAGVGWVLPDGSLLHACRVPYSRTLYDLPEPDLYGLHLARSLDDGATWHTAAFVQRDPDGRDFDNHYNAMNGQFVPVGDGRVLYVFGQFDVAHGIYRILSLDLEMS